MKSEPPPAMVQQPIPPSITNLQCLLTSMYVLLVYVSPYIHIHTDSDFNAGLPLAMILRLMPTNYWPYIAPPLQTYTHALTICVPYWPCSKQRRRLFANLQCALTAWSLACVPTGHDTATISPSVANFHHGLGRFSRASIVHNGATRIAVPHKLAVRTFGHFNAFPQLAIIRQPIAVPLCINQLQVPTALACLPPAMRRQPDC